MSDSISTPALPLQNVVPAYPYVEYSDDPNVVAFFTAYNILAGGYLAWFNSTPLGVYTSASVSGPLLDWVMNGIYGISRPVFSSLARRFVAGINSMPINTAAINTGKLYQSGSAVEATDDYYKRVATWWLYLGDGRYFNITTLRKKVARFIYGVNGTDITLSQAQSISITLSGYGSYARRAGINSAPINAAAINGWYIRKPSSSGQLVITVPAGASSQYFQQAFQQGLLNFPFMLNASVLVA
jgi:hypothetical protein